MALMDVVSKAITDAMKARDQMTLGTLRMLKSALTMKEVEKGRGLEPAEDLQVVASMVKQRRDSIEQFRKGGREELALKEESEIRVLEEYLPAAASEADIRAAIDEAVGETGAASLKDMGKVMKAALGRLSGKTVDGARVSQLVKERLS